jgi:hypothetical protein
MKASITKTKNGNFVYEVKARFARMSSSPYSDDSYAEYVRKHAFDDLLHTLDMDQVKTGAVYMVGVSEYVGPNSGVDRILLKSDNGEGWSGNSDHTIRRYHGWRGTTNDWALFGYGVRECLSVKITGVNTMRLRIVFGRDKKRNEA